MVVRLYNFFENNLKYKLYYIILYFITMLYDTLYDYIIEVNKRQK